MFFVMEAAAVLHWSRLSDRVGRKPVLLIGLTGLFISMLCFGLSRTFTTLVIRSVILVCDPEFADNGDLLSRCLAGALDGNFAIVKSAIGELTDSTNSAQGFALIPIVWSVGATIGYAAFK
jgi:MFS family permease